MISQPVCSDNGNNEAKWVLLSIALILAIAAMLLPYHQLNNTAQALAPHQIAISEVNSTELALIAELRLAHEEIRNLYQDSNQSQWPSVTELEQLWLAPFVKDKSWQRQGQHIWKKVAAGFYQGIPSVNTGAVAMLLFTDQSEPNIWLNLSTNNHAFKTQNSVISEQQLIKANWSQVIFAQQSHASHH